MSKQLIHQDRFSNFKKFPVTLLLDNITGPANIGSIFRLADAFNIEKMYICGKNIDLNSSRLQKTARATVQKVNYEIFDTSKEAIEVILAKKDYTIFALEITNDSLALNKIDFSKIKNLLLILGSENYGINKELLELSQNKIHINMYGHNSSMNVAQAAGIALYEITKSIPAIEG